jgi:hypothetical protein
MSLRATNVYEERSLGIFADRDEQEETEEEPQDAEVFSKYLGWHIRHQLSFDTWWLAGALLVLNIIEVRPQHEPNLYTEVLTMRREVT